VEITILAKKRPATKTATKSEVIREILGPQLSATVKEVRDELEKRGVKASDALINKIKYGRGKKRGGKSARGRRSGVTGPSKADAIRNMFDELGLQARSRDVISTLAQRGVVVTSAQVSTLRKTHSLHPQASSSYASTVPYEHLQAAKSLADRLGGIENARHALASLAKLLEN
jgi:hypothetical protein